MAAICALTWPQEGGGGCPLAVVLGMGLMWGAAWRGSQALLEGLALAPLNLAMAWPCGVGPDAVCELLEGTGRTGLGEAGQRQNPGRFATDGPVEKQ